MLDHGKSFRRNLILRMLSDDDLGLLSPDLERMEITRLQVLVGANQDISNIYFLEGGIASVVSTSASGIATEVGIIGREGFSGISVLLGATRSPHETFMQIDGTTAVRIGTEKFLAAVAKSLSLQKFLMRFVQTYIVQIANTAVCNSHHTIEARLARWLLMCHDRVDGDQIDLTHEFMSMMIGAQRTGVTNTLHILEGLGAIRSRRGTVIISDRQLLSVVAGDAYGDAELQYRLLLSPFGKPNVAEIVAA